MILWRIIFVLARCIRWFSLTKSERLATDWRRCHIVTTRTAFYNTVHGHGCNSHAIATGTNRPVLAGTCDNTRHGICSRAEYTQSRKSLLNELHNTCPLACLQGERIRYSWRVRTEYTCPMIVCYTPVAACVARVVVRVVRWLQRPAARQFLWVRLSSTRGCSRSWEHTIHTLTCRRCVD